MLCSNRLTNRWQLVSYRTRWT